MNVLNPPYSDSFQKVLADVALALHRVDFAKAEHRILVDLAKNRDALGDFEFLKLFARPRKPRAPRTRRERKARNAKRAAELRRLGVTAAELAAARETVRALAPARPLADTGRLLPSLPSLRDLRDFRIPSAREVRPFADQLVSFRKGSP